MRIRDMNIYCGTRKKGKGVGTFTISLRINVLCIHLFPY